jgi:hypothetical protein
MGNNAMDYSRGDFLPGFLSPWRQIPMSDIARIETLPRLIARAAAALEKATTAAEILEAKEEAAVAYTAAKRFAQLKAAHETILAACHRAQADALVIEARAQSRLADEYDAAQERGEVKKHGRKKSDIPNENITSTVEDIGLTSKQVHEARQVRDAEKAKPGVIRKVLDELLEAGKEPTHAAVKRAIKPKAKSSKPKKKPGEKKFQVAVNAPPEDWEEYKRQCEEQGVSPSRKLADFIAGEEINPASLSLTAQEKLATAIRQHKRKLDIEFEIRVLAEVKHRLDDISLPHYAKTLAQLERSITNRKGIMDRVTYRKILSCLHPDRVADPVLKKRYEDAFRLFTELEKRVLDEKESPTQFQKMPSTYDDLMKMRAEATAARRAKRAASAMARR